MHNELSKIEKELINFAKSHLQISALTRGNCPEEDHLAYYLIVEGGFDFNLADEMTELDLKLSKQTEKYFDILQFPKNQTGSFLGEKIYQRI